MSFAFTVEFQRTLAVSGVILQAFLFQREIMNDPITVAARSKA
jgi:hypothetical protein